MTNQIPKFFETNEYFIDQKINLLKFIAEFKVFDKEGSQIGFIKQRMSGGHKTLSLIIGKQIMPFLLEITDIQGNVIASVKRGWTFWMSEIQVLDSRKNIIGKIRHKLSFLKAKFSITSETGNMIAEIKGDWKGWNFEITDVSGNPIGTIGKKWAGAMKEIFTSADKYNVSIREEYAEDVAKIVVVSAAITIDMVMHQSK